jgi:hypothetical protein
VDDTRRENGFDVGRLIRLWVRAGADDIIPLQRRL